MVAEPYFQKGGEVQTDGFCQTYSKSIQRLIDKTLKNERFNVNSDLVCDTYVLDRKKLLEEDSQFCEFVYKEFKNIKIEDLEKYLDWILKAENSSYNRNRGSVLSDSNVLDVVISCCKKWKEICEKKVIEERKTLAAAHLDKYNGKIKDFKEFMTKVYRIYSSAFENKYDQIIDFADIYDRIIALFFAFPFQNLDDYKKFVSLYDKYGHLFGDEAEEFWMGKKSSFENIIRAAYKWYNSSIKPTELSADSIQKQNCRKCINFVEKEKRSKDSTIDDIVNVHFIMYGELIEVTEEIKIPSIASYNNFALSVKKIFLKEGVSTIEFGDMASSNVEIEKFLEKIFDIALSNNISIIKQIDDIEILKMYFAFLDRKYKEANNLMSFMICNDSRHPLLIKKPK